MFDVERVMNINYRNIAKIFFGLILFFLLSVAPESVFGQYTGSPVKKDLLLRELRSKQLQTRDIIQVINESGVDFKLTPLLQNELVAAGARPAVIEAVKNNYRDASQSTGKRVISKNKVNKTQPGTGGNSGQPSAITYNHLLERAIDFYDNKKNRQAANDSLQEAVKLQPKNPRAYQLLGFMNLYGARNFDEAERYWKTAINLGGSAVLRVIHDHNGIFITSCKGSLFIAGDTVRFESDDNKHTFETRDQNIKEIKVNSVFKRLVQLKQGSFKIALQKEFKDDETNFSFAPLSGSTDESKMIIRLVGKK